MLSIEYLSQLPPERRAALVGRGRSRLNDLAPAVDAIIARVRAEGDAALLDYTQRFDHVALASIAVAPEAIAQALANADPAYLAALRRAAQSITAFHQAQLPMRETPRVTTANGVEVWRAWRAIERIGIYVPGGGALYPSTLLMTAIPARIAGCRHIAVCTPPGRDGRVPDALLVAAAFAGVDAVYAVGGAQAIAALAYGTESVAQVDKIVGPGSSYVAAAKIRVAHDVAIDMPAGPSEILIIADETANPAFVTSDLLAQSEHGIESAAVLVTPSAALAEQVRVAIEAQIADLPTAAVVREALARQGALLVAASPDDAIAFANDYAAEHLEIITQEPQATLARIRHAGSVFLGNFAPVAAGDYATGSNHTLPTARFARSFAPLSVETFGRWIQVQSLTSNGLAELRSSIETLATVEGLPAHAASIRTRFAGENADITDQSSAGEAAREGGLRDRRRGFSRQPVILNANENPRGPSPRTRELLAGNLPDVFRYPDEHQTRLREALAAELGVAPDQIIVGNGSDEILHFISLVMLQPDDEIIICDPTFGVYRAEANRRGAKVIDVPRRDDFTIDGEAVAAAITPRTRIIWLCSPNNPTGTPCDLAIVPPLLNRGPVVVVDEAYRQPDGITAIPLLRESPNLIVTQTLSKVGGLAGLRIGYAIAAPEMIARLEAQRLPYNVNGVAQAAALTTLEDSAWVAETWRDVLAEREKLAARLRDIPGVRVWPSAANFLLVEFPGRDGEQMRAALAEQGVLVRHYPQERLRSSVRVTIGLPEENDAFVAALAQVLASQLAPGHPAAPDRVARPRRPAQEVKA